MHELHYRLVNVFGVSGNPFSGNPLAVFLDGSSLASETMQAIGRQFNLAEITFCIPPENLDADARVRIFTPTIEMPFAGHPTLGTAHVLSQELARTTLGLSMKAGRVDVSIEGDRAELKTARAPTFMPFEGGSSRLAEVLHLPARAIKREPLWVDTGVRQLVVELASETDVEEAVPTLNDLLQHCFNPDVGEGKVYVLAQMAPGTWSARFLYTMLGAVHEDAATGSACANFGGYLMHHGIREGEFSIAQGARVGRPSQLGLRLHGGDIYVSGRVEHVGSGVFWLRSA